jgi:predicted regulator of Ras-like GTPase activity (Roadblock/LC7/MglB family)
VTSSKDAPSRHLQRDRPDSAFSFILNRFVEVHEEVQAAVVVDCDGECIDYASVIDPYEAKVFGAALLGTTAEITAATRRMGAGSPIQWVVEAARYDLLVRRLSDDFTLVVVLSSRGLSGHVLAAMNTLADALRHEAGVTAASWDPSSVPFRVQTRFGPDGEEVPASVYDAGVAQAVVAVLARWTERGVVSSADRTCFRVRVARGELTLVFEPATKHWHRR